MADGDYLNRSERDGLRHRVNGRTYSTTTPIPADRADAPAVIEWRGMRLERSPRVSYGNFYGWWNQADIWPFSVQVDLGAAAISLNDDEGAFESFRATGASPEEALEAARKLLLTKLREWAVVFGAVFHE